MSGEELSSQTPLTARSALNYDNASARTWREDSTETASFDRHHFAKALKRYLNHRELDID